MTEHRLDVVADEILARHGVPLDLPHGDRGDLASSLAEALGAAADLRERQWCLALIAGADGDPVLINRIVSAYLDLRDGRMETPGWALRRPLPAEPCTTCGERRPYCGAPFRDACVHVVAAQMAEGPPSSGAFDACAVDEPEDFEHTWTEP